MIFPTLFGLGLVLQLGILAKACNEIVVETASGKVRGVSSESILGFEYCSFKGIPYARPPVGDLRFKDSLPVEPWNGIFEANAYNEPCMQNNFLFKGTVGQEDCLHLNIYVRHLDTTSKLPVMFYIHGGGFFYGTSDDSVLSPDYFMKRTDVILVTSNHRLGIYGFLNMGIEVASGNQGLKDQVLALKWVRDNVENFGGDPNRITVVGHDSGAASVHYLALSPMAKGLFHGAVIQSGTVFNPWAFPFGNRSENGHLVAEELGSVQSKDPKAVVEFLTTVDAENLTLAQGKFVDREMLLKYQLPFGPTVDDDSTNPFMPANFVETLQRGIQVPLIIGYTNREGLVSYLARLKKSTFEEFNDNFSRYLHPKCIELFKKRYNLSVDELKRMYYGDSRISYENLEEFIDLYGDVYVVEGVHRTIEAQVRQRNPPTYLYVYSYDKGFSLSRVFSTTNSTGAGHGDELTNQFRMKLLEKLGFKTLEIGGIFKLMEQMIDMWVNFVNTGSPTPSKTELLPVKWEPVDDSNNFRYLNLGSSLTMENVQNIVSKFSSKKFN